MTEHEITEVEGKGRRARGASDVQARVLIVDDIPDNCALLSVLCEQLGLAVECVEDGREAVNAARTGGFDVILMDIFMPRMDGIEATRIIRGMNGRTAETPIVAVTTAAEPGHVLHYLECGMTAVIAKPIVPQRLAETLSKVLGRQLARTARRGRTPARKAA
jgi:CheY-like chemotaxis protein